MRKIKTFKNGTSKIERRVCKLLGGKKFKIDKKEFDIKLPNTNIIIEIDGDYWHPRKLENLSLTQINNFINDVYKENLVKDKFILYRILTSKLKRKRKIDLDFIKENHCPLTLKIKDNSILVNKNYIDKNKHELLKDKNLSKLIKFIELTSDIIIDENYKIKIKNIISENKINFCLKNILN